MNQKSSFLSALPWGVGIAGVIAILAIVTADFGIGTNFTAFTNNLVGHFITNVIIYTLVVWAIIGLKRRNSERSFSGHQETRGGIGLWGFAVIAVIVTLAFLVGMNVGQIGVAASTPTPTQYRVLTAVKIPTPTPRPTPTRRPIIDGCFHYSDITVEDAWKKLCVFGKVVDAYKTDNGFHIIFSEDHTALRFINPTQLYEEIIGEVVRATGVVEIYQGMPYIEISGDLQVYGLSE